MPAPRSLRVWPLPLRAAHAALAACVIGCGLLYEGGPWHEGLGHAALALALARLLAGFVGPGPRSPARFARFVHGPRATWAYARQVAAGTEPRHVGHNPLGAWMMLALLLGALAAAGLGALYVTDRFWGDETVWRLHALAGWAVLALVPLHVAGAVMASRRHRENLVRAMLDGRKRPPAGSDIAP